MADLPLKPSDPTRDAEPGTPQAGIGLCLSGGGYRAMLFHVGTLWRLHEAGILGRVDRISSVSGGSITSGVLALAWKAIHADPSRDTFVNAFVAKVRAMAGQTIDVGSVVAGLLPGITIAGRVAAAYRKYLYGNATLQDLPDTPRFIFNATSVQTGALWRFSKPYMGDYRVGRVLAPTLDLATAVTASSAFPPILSPVVIKLTGKETWDTTKTDLPDPAFRQEVILSDGGVYDNLGLETVWKRYTSVLVSDAGAKIAADADPHGDWARGSLRIFDLVDNQVRSLRKRQLVGGYLAPPGSADHRAGAYWSIRSAITDYPAAGLPCPLPATTALAATPTRLAAVAPELQERLINWGYAVCDGAIRSHVDPKLPPGTFPYARGV